MSWGREVIDESRTTEPRPAAPRPRRSSRSTSCAVFRGRDRLVALLGAWHHGEALIAFDPVEVLDGRPVRRHRPRPSPPDDGFGGGWIGAWGYQLGRLIEDLPAAPPRPSRSPITASRSTTTCSGAPTARGGSSRCRRRCSATPRIVEVARRPARRSAQTYDVGTFEMTPTPERHRAALAEVLDHIAAGDIFQANLCARLEAPFDGDPLDVFCAGVEALAPGVRRLRLEPRGRAREPVARAVPAAHGRRGADARRSRARRRSTPIPPSSSPRPRTAPRTS